MKKSFNIIYELRSGTPLTESVTFDCNFPNDAIRIYVEWQVNHGENIVSAKVYPTDNAMEFKKTVVVPPAPPVVKSKLFNGYTKKEDIEFFPCPNSAWIFRVFWDNGTITIMAIDGREFTYNCEKNLFNTFRGFVESGGSAGAFFNKFIKGLS